MKVLIIGAGKLGLRLATALSDEDIDITVMDHDDHVIQRVKNELDVLTVEGNALDFNLLKEIGIGDYDLAISTVSSDESNVLISSVVKKLGCKASIARVRDTQYHDQISFISKELDIDHVVNPDMATAITIEKYLLKKYSLVVDEFAGGRVKIVEFNIGQDPGFVGKKLSEVESLDENLLISAISREGQTLIPNGSTVMEENDIILLTGSPQAVDAFDRDHSHVEAVLPVNKVLILGAGNLGHYLTQFLLADGIDVTVVERDREKAEAIKETYPEALVLLGDGTDFNFLQDEMVTPDGYDAFVAVTGIDESNLLMGMAMRQEGIRKVVAKISRPHFTWLLERLDLDAVFSPNIITAGVILKIIRGQEAPITPILEGNGEIVELSLSHDLPILGKPLRDLTLPKDMLLAAVLRGEEVLVPYGSTVLQAGDRVIVFCLHQDLKDIKAYFNAGKQKKGWFL